MKTLLHYLFVLFCTLVCSVTGYSQLNYSQDFEVEDNPWNEYDFGTSDYTSCTGTYALEGYVYNYPDWGFGYDSEVISPSVGTSNGMLATLTYSYKIWNWDDSALSNSPDWGSLIWEYSTSASGPWTQFQLISPSTHVVSSGCVVKTATFTPPPGQQVYLRFRSEYNTSSELEFYVYIDDLTVTQAAAPGCAGTPAASVAVAASATVCNQQSASLSLSPFYTATGLTFQWQKSTDGTNYTNIVGATASTLTAPQTVNTWYRAIVTCTASTSSVTSTGVQVTNSGLNCMCPVEFTNNVEPITNVTFATINNTTSATLNGTPDVENFAGVVPTALVYKDSTYPISLQGNTDGSSFTTFFKVFIDFNQNGNLDEAGESFQAGSVTGSTGTDGQTATGNILIPATALTGITNMRIIKLFSSAADGYPTLACPTAGLYGYGQVEDYLINIQPCGTLAPVADANQSFCVGATLSNIAVTGTSVKWYAAETGGTALGANVVLVSGTTYYASSTSGCESATRTGVTVTINNPVADSPDDVTSCGSYILPELTNGSYFTEAGGLGDTMLAGDEITQDTTIYVNNTVGTCSAENSFTVTITSMEVDQLEDTTVCSEYILPELTSGTYYTGGSGLGDQLEAGDAITETMTIHIYGASDVNPACTAETTFTVTVISVEADELDDVDVCSAYVLPALSPGNSYYTETGGQGSALVSGSVIAASQTIYIYTIGDSSMQCSDETSFTVTVADIDEPIVDEEILYELDLTGGLFLNQVEVEAEGTLTWYASEEDAENGVNPISSDTVVPTGTTTYYVTQTVGECESEPAEVTITVVVLDAKEFDMAAFSYYPNPVIDVLNLSYSENITGVEVLNLVGQRVMSAEYDQDKVQLNLSQLASGTYLIKVSTENASKTIKVVKNK